MPCRRAGCAWQWSAGRPRRTSARSRSRLATQAREAVGWLEAQRPGDLDDAGGKQQQPGHANSPLGAVGPCGGLTGRVGWALGAVGWHVGLPWMSAVDAQDLACQPAECAGDLLGREAAVMALVGIDIGPERGEERSEERRVGKEC